jgi:hypothetical protein
MNARYVCVRKCYHGKGPTVAGKAPPRRIYKVGDMEVFDPTIDEIPRHFAPVDENPPVVPEPPPQGRIIGVRAPVDPDKLKIDAKKTAKKAGKVEDFA